MSKCDTCKSNKSFFYYECTDCVWDENNRRLYPMWTLIDRYQLLINFKQVKIPIEEEENKK